MRWAWASVAGALGSAGISAGISAAGSSPGSGGSSPGSGGSAGGSAGVWRWRRWGSRRFGGAGYPAGRRRRGEGFRLEPVRADVHGLLGRVGHAAEDVGEDHPAQLPGAAGLQHLPRVGAPVGLAVEAGLAGVVHAPGDDRPVLFAAASPGDDAPARGGLADRDGVPAGLHQRAHELRGHGRAALDHGQVGEGGHGADAQLAAGEDGGRDRRRGATQPAGDEVGVGDLGRELGDRDHDLRPPVDDVPGLRWYRCRGVRDDLAHDLSSQSRSCSEAR